MAYITLNSQKLRGNYEYLDHLFTKNSIEWSIVTKMLCGNKKYIEEVIKLGIKQICDSRLSNLKLVKSIDETVQTVYVKPPPKGMASKIVQIADISYNTEYETIKSLSDAAVEFDKVHKIVIMIELGELREGVMRETFIEFYKKVFELPNIDVIGIGTNLTCMNGVLPSHDKLIQLSLYKQLVEVHFGKKIPYVSGGSSVTIPLIYNETLPKGINHFRVGESLFLGTDVYNNRPSAFLFNDVFKLFAEIIELTEKPMLPDGEMGLNLQGQEVQLDANLEGTTAYRAIVDLGLLDIEEGHLIPVLEDMKIAGSSSDMIVLDIGENKRNLEVGQWVEFTPNYMGVMRLMNSNYIEKRIEEESEVKVQWSDSLPHG
jgi:ornithine racemase